MNVDDYLDLATLALLEEQSFEQIQNEVEHLRLRVNAIGRLKNVVQNEAVSFADDLELKGKLAVMKLQRAPRTCAVCHIRGHDRRSCPTIYGETSIGESFRGSNLKT
jgi:hypothetical protein